MISAINSLTLSPALAALLLKPHTRPLNRFFRLFNRYFGAASNAYSRTVGAVLSRKTLMMGVYIALLAVTGVLFKAVPDGFVPQQDKQYLIGFAQRRRDARPHRGRHAAHGRDHDEAARRQERGRLPGPVDQRLHQQLERGHRVRFAGRLRQAQVARALRAIAGALKQFAQIQDAFIVIFPPPPVQGLGTTGGFKLYLEDRASLGYEALDQAFLMKAYQTPELAACSRPTRSTCRSSTPTSTAPRRASSACR